MASLISMGTADCRAMDLELEGDQLYMRRPIGTDDWVKYREISKDKAIRRVVLMNSSGGHVQTAIGIAEDLESRGVDTVLAGYCLSACTYIFVAGRNRQVSNAWPPNGTRLGIHGTYEIAGSGMGGFGRTQVFQHYRRRLGDKFDADLFNRAIQGTDKSGFLVFYHPVYFKGKATQFCDGSARPSELACEPIPGKDAHSVGLLTSLEPRASSPT